MKALILAAGRGSRLLSLTDDRPKGLTLLKGKTLIERQVSSLQAAGIKTIAAATGYLSEKITPYICEQYVNKRWSETNMVSSLINARAFCEDHDCIVTYSDIIYGSNIVTALINEPGDIVVAYDPNWLQQWQVRFDNPLDDAETFSIDDAGRLLEIGDKTDNLDDIQGQYMGLIKLSPKGMQHILNATQDMSPKALDKLDMTALLQHLINLDITINTIANKEFWFEIDDQKDLAVCEKLLPQFLE